MVLNLGEIRLSEYIEISLFMKHNKTNEYSVHNKKTNYLLGTIKWYNAWQQYCFFPMEETVWNKDCMQYIIDFIKDLMEKRKK